MRNKYTYLEIESFIQDYCNEVMSNRYLRFGQWFYNNYDTSGEPFPELFYEPSIKKATELIYNNYLKEEQ
jgi:hypothetical protein